jgi:hypothetical protein
MIRLHSSPMRQAETNPRFLRRSAIRMLVLAVPAASLAGLLLIAMPAPVFSQSVPQVDVAKVAFGYRASKMFEREIVSSQARRSARSTTLS